jgi:hypothetical protein
MQVVTRNRNQFASQSSFISRLPAGKHEQEMEEGKNVKINYALSKL